MTAAARPRVTVCGIGPAGDDLVTRAALDAIARIRHRFLRTARHPSARVVGEARSFDHLYESAATIEEVYAGIVAVLVAAADAYGEVLYAVPGSPAVAERTVEMLLALGDHVDVEVIAGLSFLDLAWARLGIDPIAAGARLVDGHRFESEAAGERGPLLVAQCDHRDVLSEVKLAIGDVLDGAERHGPPADDEPGAPLAAGHGSATGPGDPRGPGGPTRPGTGEPTVTVLQRLGLPDEEVRQVAWHDLDRTVEPDHLTAVWIPRLAAPIAGEVAAFAAVVRRLRADCPWDRAQTHQSLRRHLLEEAYEVLEAIDHLDVEAGAGYEALEEELGDLLFQVVFHATLAAEEGRFTLADVARGISGKLVRRHPHVFGGAETGTPDELAATWERLKKVEKGRASVMDGIPSTLPALLYALKVQKKAASEGVDWRTLVAGTGVGARLLDLVAEAAAAGVDPETELRLAAEQVRDRFRQV